jgi:hypothetical protein
MCGPFVPQRIGALLARKLLSPFHKTKYFLNSQKIVSTFSKFACIYALKHVQIHVYFDRVEKLFYRERLYIFS